jgi:hemoglobin
MPFAVNPAARERWLQLMTNALDEVQLPGDVDALLREFFAGVSAMLVNRPE